MIKKLLNWSILLTILIVCVCLLPTKAQAASQNNLTFELNADGESYSVTNCTNANGTITIPSTYYGKPVTGIGDGAFDHCYYLTSVTIPEGVTRIGEEAFYCCYQLSNIIIPKSVTSIGDLAFCTCEELTSVIIPEGVTTIGAGSFQGCSKLTGITLPASLTYIDPSAFWYCIRLQDLQLSEHNENYSLDINGVLFNKDKTELVYAPIACIGNSYAIPNSVTSIGRYAFSGCNMTSITIPDSVATIGNGAFEACNDLVSITIPNSITTIGYNTFAYCTGLTEIIIPDKVTDIGNYAFQNCTGLTAITIPNSVSSIDDYAFYQCFKLKNVIILSDVLTVDSYTFASCNRLTDVWFSCSENDQNNFTIDSIGNTYFIDATWHYNYCGLDRHIYDKACDPVCSICGFVGVAAEHSYTNSCDTTCDVCSFTRAITHSYDNSCDTTCNICSYGRTVADHIYTNSCDTTCNECGAMRFATHTYDNACDTTCNVCRHERETSHVYDNADDVTCNVCKQTLAPVAPTLESVTDNTVMLVAVAGYEYSKNGTTWQKSNIFTGLQPVASYQFYQRVAAGTDNLASPASSPLSVTTDKYIPDVPGDFTFLEITDTSVTFNAVADCQYSMDGIYWKSSPAFTNLTPGTQYTFYQRVAEGDRNYTSDKAVLYITTYSKLGTITYDANGGKDAPVSTTGKISTQEPTRSGHRFVGWALTSDTYAVYLPGARYSQQEDITLYAVWSKQCSACNGKAETYHKCIYCSGTGWKSERESCSSCGGDGSAYNKVSCPVDFCYSGTLILNGQYYGKCSTCGGDGVFEEPVKCSSCNGAGGFVHLYDCERCSGKGSWYSDCTQCTSGFQQFTPEAPQVPKLQSVSSNTVVLLDYSTCEYSIDGVNWQDNNVFSNLDAKTRYVFYQRYKATAYTDHSYASYGLTVVTEDLPSYQVVFKNWDDSVISSGIYYYGDKVKIPADPTKTTDNTYTYTFTGWDKEIVDCAGDATYTATYKATYIDYKVIFQYEDGTTIAQYTLHYGDEVVVPEDPAVPEVLGSEYVFVGWDKEVAVCTENAVYTAVFRLVYPAGDITKDNEVTNEDVIYLLWHTLFPESYPIESQADFTGDGQITNEDVIYLLWHTLFPESYPLIEKKKIIV